MKSDTQPRMMRMKQLITYTSMSRAYLYQKIAEGELHEGYQISAGVRAWEKSEIDNWLNERMGREES
jgi:predicted DNA-binding transcriptional regulator AlpA